MTFAGDRVLYEIRILNVHKSIWIKILNLKFKNSNIVSHPDIVLLCNCNLVTGCTTTTTTTTACVHAVKGKLKL